MIKALIVDDEKNNRENLATLLQKYGSYVNVIGSANSVDAAFTFIREQSPDLVFLDIKMPEKDGFQLLEAIEHINFEVIIVTAYNEFAIKAIKFCALDYLLKPIDVIELSNAVDRAKQKITLKQENNQLKQFIQNLKNENTHLKIALPDNEKVEFVEIHEIIHLVGDNNYTHVYFTNAKRKTISKTLKDYETLLTEHNFIRVHRSHLINSQYIKSYFKNDGGYILMSNNSKIPISRNKKAEVLEKLRLYIQ